jgi:hypothetical protein
LVLNSTGDNHEYKKISWFFIPIAAVVLSSCGSASAKILNTETPETVPNIESSEEIRIDDVDVQTKVEDVKAPPPISEEPETGEITNHAVSECGDPFEGVTLHFVPSS